MRIVDAETSGSGQSEQESRPAKSKLEKERKNQVQSLICKKISLTIYIQIEDFNILRF